MKQLISIFILVLVLAACDDQEIQDLRKKQEYTFNVTSLDKSKFAASIRWGRNDLEYVEHIDAHGFASSVELGPADKMVLTVDAPGLYVSVSNNRTREIRYFYPSPGEPLIVWP